MRKTSAVLTAIAVLPLAVGVPAPVPVAAAAATAQRAVAPVVQQLPLRGVDAGALDLGRSAPAVLTAPRPTRPFSLVAVTWPAGSPVVPRAVQVRVRTAGRWTAWQTLPASDVEPDDDSAEGRNPRVRGGTDPLMTPPSDGVQVRVDTSDGRVPAGLRLELVDPGSTPADAHLTPRPADAAAPAAAAVRVPSVITRAQWGADESLRSGPPRYSDTITAGFVHHTAGSNSYSPAIAAAQVRAVYAYHTQGRGWSDIGYNFLVDKWGRIYEGRYGGMDLPVHGAHTGGFNTNTFAVSALGNYDVADAPSAIREAVARVFAWKLALHGRDPRGTARLVSSGGGTSKYRAGTPVRVNVVSGHRNVGYTSCPGSYLYADLGLIRARTDVLASGSPPNPIDVGRLSGDDRYDTSAVVARSAYPVGRSVVLASGESDHVVDGLVAASLSLQHEVPVLLSRAGALPGGVAAELDRRGATTAYLVGGRSALGRGVEAGLRRLGVTRIVRYAGSTRYSTAAAVARAVGAPDRKAVVASGDDAHLVDALAAAPPAARARQPILLVAPGSVPTATQEALAALGVTATTVVGGETAVSDPVLRALPRAARVAGSDRYSTAAHLASVFAPLVGSAQVVVVSGADGSLVDALAGASFGRVTLLTTPTALAGFARDWIQDHHDVDNALVIGGPAAVSANTAVQVSAAIRT